MVGGEIFAIQNQSMRSGFPCEELQRSPFEHTFRSMVSEAGVNLTFRASFFLHTHKVVHATSN